LNKEWNHFYDNIPEGIVLKEHKTGKRYDIMIDKLYKFKKHINIYKVCDNFLDFELIDINLLIS